MSQNLVFNAIYQPLAQELHYQQFDFNAATSEMTSERQPLEVA